MLDTYFARSDFASCNSIARSDHNNIEIHTENASRRVVLKTQIDVLINTKPEVASRREVLLLELIFLNLEPSVKNLIRFEPSNLDSLY